MLQPEFQMPAHLSYSHTVIDLLPEGIPDTWEEYREVTKSLTNKDEGMYGISVSATTGSLAGVYLIIYFGRWEVPGQTKTGM